MTPKKKNLLAEYDRHLKFIRAERDAYYANSKNKSAQWHKDNMSMIIDGADTNDNSLPLPVGHTHEDIDQLFGCIESQ